MKPIWMKRCLTWMKSLFDDNGKKFELYEFFKHMDYIHVTHEWMKLENIVINK